MHSRFNAGIIEICARASAPIRGVKHGLVRRRGATLLHSSSSTERQEKNLHEEADDETRLEEGGMKDNVSGRNLKLGN